MAIPFLGRSGVAGVEISGTIGVGLRVAEYSRILDGIRRDRRFKAVIVEIDSPGGAASGSELLYHSLAKVALEKPVVSLHQGGRRLRRLLHKLRRHQDSGPALDPGAP